MTTNFLYYLMISEVGQSQIFSGFKGSGREGLGNEAIKIFKIPLAKTKEQQEISDYLDFFSDNIKKEKSIIEQQIEKLNQYRKCLIHECVTGKRKVTND
jgi:type I restriction enzyme S subunit